MPTIRINLGIAYMFECAYIYIHIKRERERERERERDTHYIWRIGKTAVFHIVVNPPTSLSIERVGAPLQ